MRYKLLGNSGLRVCEICLGTMSFGEDFGWGISEPESRQIFDAFVEGGGNFIDTANEVYNGGSSEKFLGEFIASDCIAQQMGCTPAQVSINWVRSKGIIPILGANKISQLQADLACLDFQLSTEHLKALDDVSTIELGFPHDFLAITKESTFGGMFNLIGDRPNYVET